MPERRKGTARLGSAPGALPLIGHAHRFLRAPLPFMMSLPRYGDLVRVRLGSTRALVVCEPALARQVLREDRVFDKGGPVARRMRDVLGNGLVACPYSDHRRQRRLLQAAFRRDRLAGYARIMLEQIDAVTGSWRPGEAVDVPEQMKRLTTRVIVAAMFAHRIPPGRAQEVVDDFTTVMSQFGLVRTMVPPVLLRLPLPANRRHDRARDRLRGTVAGMVAAARAEGADHGDLLSMLVRAEEETGDGFSDTEAVDQMCTFFIGGVDTTAHLLASALHVITHRPALQERLAGEAARALADGPLGHDRLPALPLTGRVVSETLRLYPPGWLISRYTSEDTELGGHPVPTGTPVMVSPYQVQREPAAYARGAQFDPARWEAAGRAGRDTFLSFGVGARKCIGDEFAHTETVLALAAVLGRWRLHLVEAPEREPRFMFNLPAGTLKVTVTERPGPARGPRARHASRVR